MLRWRNPWLAASSFGRCPSVPGPSANAFKIPEAPTFAGISVCNIQIVTHEHGERWMATCWGIFVELLIMGGPLCAIADLHCGRSHCSRWRYSPRSNCANRNGIGREGDTPSRPPKGTPILLETNQDTTPRWRA